MGGALAVHIAAEAEAVERTAALHHGGPIRVDERAAHAAHVHASHMSGVAMAVEGEKASKEISMMEKYNEQRAKLNAQLAHLGYATKSVSPLATAATATATSATTTSTDNSTTPTAKEATAAEVPDTTDSSKGLPRDDENGSQMGAAHSEVSKRFSSGAYIVQPNGRILFDPAAPKQVHTSSEA